MKRTGRAQRVEFLGAAGPGNGKEPGVDEEEEPEQDLEPVAVSRHGGHVQGEQQGQAGVQRRELAEPVGVLGTLAHCGEDPREHWEHEEDRRRQGQLPGRQEAEHPTPLVQGGERQAERHQDDPPFVVAPPRPTRR